MTASLDASPEANRVAETERRGKVSTRHACRARRVLEAGPGPLCVWSDSHGICLSIAASDPPDGRKPPAGVEYNFPVRAVNCRSGLFASLPAGVECPM